jgi:hypothetical protein
MAHGRAEIPDASMQNTAFIQCMRMMFALNTVYRGSRFPQHGCELQTESEGDMNPNARANPEYRHKSDDSDVIMADQISTNRVPHLCNRRAPDPASRAAQTALLNKKKHCSRRCVATAAISFVTCSRPKCQRQRAARSAVGRRRIGESTTKVRDLYEDIDVSHGHPKATGQLLK